MFGPHAHSHRIPERAMNSRQIGGDFKGRGSAQLPGIVKHPGEHVVNLLFTACVTRVGNSRRSCTAASAASGTLPFSREGMRMLAVATAS